MGSIIFISVILLFVILQVVAVRGMHGFWRALAYIPAAALVIIVAIIVIGIIHDPTSHNLWPLEILMWSAGGIVFLGVLFLVKKIAA